MLDLRNAKRVVVLGGGTAGWFAALTLRRMFSSAVEVRVVESPTIGIIGVGEGGLINLVEALNRLDIPTSHFMRETGATFKLGFLYEGWRTGAADDRYFHLFASPNTEETRWNLRGYFPLLSALLADGRDLHRYIKGFAAIADGASQREMAELLAGGQSGLSASFHFDSYKVAHFLRNTALARGVVHVNAEVRDIELNAAGRATGLRLDDGETLALDFLVDASGISRVGIGKKLGVPWRSFSQHLLLDRAVPFYLKHPGPNPGLVTRAIALQAGWMWHIPLVERIGAGTVFSSAHTSAEQAVAEVEAKLGTQIEPQRVLSFEPGHFERVWVGNMIALGLSSGFVEPLEATSIGQMLEQLRNFERIVVECDGVVAQTTIDAFNRSNALCWDGIRDFLRMHYDCGRRDTPFWQDVARSPYTDSYAQLRQCFAARTPRLADINGYVGQDWQGIFHTINWLFVGAPLGVITPAAARAELLSLPREAQTRVASYLNAARAAAQFAQPSQQA